MVVIDQETCTGCGTCAALCDEVFELDDSGKAQIVEEYRGDDPSSGSVPDDVGCVDTAIQSCPVNAISAD